MGANSATKIIDNIFTVLVMKLFNESQAIYFRKPAKTLLNSKRSGF